MTLRQRSILNVLSVDLEDWFCVSNMEAFFPYGMWDNAPLRLERSADTLLDILDSACVKGTFFVLGWIADRLPNLVNRIYRAGHEIALHGYAHRRITAITAEEFERDLDQALESISRIVPREFLLGYRAPSFTITERTAWALDILASRGLRYDSSVFPAAGHPDYGWAGHSANIHRLPNGLIELPITPWTGGGYFRLFPYSLTGHLLSGRNAQGHPAVFYIHPWELDTEQPRLKLPFFKRFRHYINLKRVAPRLKRLLSDFSFGTASEVLKIHGF